MRSFPTGAGVDAGAASFEPLAIQTDGTTLFIVTNDGTYIAVLQQPLAGGNGKVVSGNLTNPTNLALAGSDVLFVDDSNNCSTGTVQRVPQAGGNPKEIAGGLVGRPTRSLGRRRMRG